MNKKKSITNAVLGVLLLIVSVVGIVKFTSSDSAPPPAPSPSITPTQTATTNAAKPKLPLLDMYPSAPEVSEGTVKTAVKNDTIAVEPGGVLTLKGSKIINPVDPCSSTEITDFCLVGRIVTDTPADIFFLKDAARSRLFENPKGFAPVKVPGSPAAATLKLNLGENDASAFVVLNKNSSGWMIVPKGDKAATSLKTLTGGASIK